ncbi:hypothetical protein A2U01_0117242, partial [Trifolium medium]|nr:hypothetical protein [Trifolium medium]
SLVVAAARDFQIPEGFRRVLSLERGTFRSPSLSFAVSRPASLTG